MSTTSPRQPDAPKTSASPGREPEIAAVTRSARSEPLAEDAAAYLIEGADAWRVVPLPAVVFGLIAALGTALATADLIAASAAFLLALAVLPVIMLVGSEAAFRRRATELGLPEARAEQLRRAYRKARAQVMEIDDDARLQKLCEAVLREDRRALDDEI